MVLVTLPDTNQDLLRRELKLEDDSTAAMEEVRKELPANPGSLMLGR